MGLSRSTGGPLVFAWVAGLSGWRQERYGLEENLAVDAE